MDPQHRHGTSRGLCFGHQAFCDALMSPSRPHAGGGLDIELEAP